MKKSVSIVLVLFMLVSVFTGMSVTVSAATSGTTGSCNWRFNGINNSLTISPIGDRGNMEDYTYFVGENPIPWYDLKDKIETVIIQSGVEHLGASAFSNCTNLTTVTVADTVQTIAQHVFSNCKKLNNISGLENVTSIDFSAFKNCESLTSISIPKCTNFGGGVFEGCKNLNSIELSEGIEKINQYLFESCSALYSITIPNGVKEIDYEAFKSCNGLSSITLPKSLSKIGENAFYGCDKIRNIYYEETEEDWNLIEVDTGNTKLGGATVHFNSKPVQTEPVTDKPTEPVTAETTEAVPKTPKKYLFLPNSDEQNAGYNYKLVVQDINSEISIYDFSATAMKLEGVPVYSAEVPANITPAMLQYQIYDGENWVKQVNKSASEIAALNGKIIKSDGSIYGEDTPATVNPTQAPTQGVTDKPTQPRTTEPIETKPITTEPTTIEPQPLKKDISNWTVEGLSDKTYTGKLIEPEFYVVSNDGEYAKFTVSYRNNKNVGTATAIVKGIGDYIGTITKSFKINKASQNISVKFRLNLLKLKNSRKKLRQLRRLQLKTLRVR